MTAARQSARFLRRRDLVRALNRGVHGIQRRRRWGLLRAVEWLRRQLGLDLAGWHALTNAAAGRAVDPVALERLERLSTTWARPIKAEEWT